ncbi:hypothetical protein RNJ44_01799 [Nakaseomyces bracarensis]|uniref:type II protein arginine methyltransferase n=1 Tax=Nakaseomyces bracarensis TaxID=273131 RepID=A0ABR4NNU8_9SACH
MSISRLLAYTSKRYISRTRTVPLRDFLEWINLPNVVKKENFFIDYHTTLKHGLLSSHFRTLSQVFDNSLAEYEPELSQCLAKSLLVDYKLNEYPYYDLTVLNIFTNADQASKILGSVMEYLKSELSQSMLERIRIFMVPLYKLQPEEKRRLNKLELPANIEVFTESAIFEYADSFDGMTDIDASLAIKGHVVVEDPVHVVVFNDVLENLSHDLVRYHEGQWEQCYIDIDPSGNKSKRFQAVLDPLCQQTIDHLILGSDSRKQITSDTEIYVPTQIVNLFNVLRYRVPEHKLFAVDMFQPPDCTSIWHRFIKSVLALSRTEPEGMESSTLVLGYNECQHRSIGNDDNLWHRALKFIPNPHQLQRLYTSVHDGRKICNIEPLDIFIDNWNGKTINHKNKSLYVMHARE